MQKRVEKPWGYEIIWAQTPHYVGKILFIKGGHRLSYQYHEKKEETFYLSQGVIEFEFEDAKGRQVRQMKAGEEFHVPVGMKHRMIAVEDATVFEVSTPFLQDVVRIEDNYGRI